MADSREHVQEQQEAMDRKQRLQAAGVDMERIRQVDCNEQIVQSNK
jgi:hypothetical protein